MRVDNRTPAVVGQSFGRTLQGEECIFLILKSTFSWQADGRLVPEREGAALVEADLFTGEAGVSSMAYAADTLPPKARTDVYLVGSISLPEPKPLVDVSLQVGSHINKVVRVFGTRLWQRQPKGPPTPGRAEPFSEMPLEWERAYGGVAMSDPKLFEPCNPIGCGVVTNEEAPGPGHRLPNFEWPAEPTSWGKRRAPAGFGPLCPHWQPRATRAGTHDDRWKQLRAPLPPEDFDVAYFNVAPDDQQLSAFPSGEIVTLTNFTRRRQESFVVPPSAFPVTLVDDGHLIDRQAAPDTLVIDLDERRILLRSALAYVPCASLLDLTAAIVGPLSLGERKALLYGKRYVRLRECGPSREPRLGLDGPTVPRAR